MKIKKNSLDMIAQAYSELSQIPCRGEDTIRMCKALTWLKASYEQLTEVYKEQEDKEDE